jgi:Ca2+-binding RTX toxin-like protein
MGIKADLTVGRGYYGDAALDQYVSIEGILGSAYADTLIGSSGVNVFAGGMGADILDGREGNDAASYQSSAESVHVDLTRGSGFSGDAAGDRISNIEKVIGSAHADTLFGKANSTLEGGAGADKIDGQGNDVFAGYESSAAGVRVDLASGIGSAGDAEGDRIVNVNGLIGSIHADTLIGGMNTDTLLGGSGSDILEG